MAIIWRRPSRTSDPDARAWPTPPVASAITAAVSPVAPENWAKAAKHSNAQDWQDQCWKMLDIVGELSFSVLWKQALLSRIRLVASDIDPETGIPTGSTDNETAKAIVSRIAGGTTGQSQMIARLSPLLNIPGEGWFAIIYPVDKVTGQTVETWLVLSRDEVRARGDKVELLMPDGSKYVMNEETDTLERVWRPDPHISSLAWSPAKAALPILRRMVRMEQAIEAAGKSRIAGNGILLLPSEITLPSQEPPTGAQNPDAPNLPPAPEPPPVYASAADIRKAIQDAMAAAIEDQTSAAALVPLILMAKAEFLKEVRHLKFDSEVSDKAQAALEAATRRLAMTLAMPAEVMLGMADLNHWSLWGIENEAVRWYAAPEMEIICDSLTQTLLLPQLPEGSGVVIWYDTVDVEAAPDDQEKVRTAYTDGVANSETYLRSLNLSADDGYDLSTREGLTAWAGDQIRRDATLVPVLLPLLRTLIPAVADASPAPAVDAAPDAPKVIDAPQQGPPEQPAMAASVTVRMCVNEALRLAGTRRRSRATHAQLRGVAAVDTHRHLGPVDADDIPRLIDGWDAIADPTVLAAAQLSPDQLARLVVAEASAALLDPGRAR